MAVFRYEFAGFSFNLDQGLAFKGCPINLAPQQRRVLDVLLSCSNREISKEELIAKAWPGEAIADNGLYRCIYLLRRALSHPDGIDIIATAYNRGLRIAVPVVRADHALPDTIGRILQTASIPAFETWQQGREALGRRTSTDVEAALRAFRTSIELDPRFLPAWSGQVECHIVQALRGYLRPREAARRGQQAAWKARDLCPGDDGDLMAASAWIRAALEWQFDEGLAGLNRAIQLNPVSWKVRYYRGWVLHVVGRSGDALYDLRTALALNPLAGAAHTLHGWILFCTQREQEALNYLSGAARQLPWDDTLQITLAVVAAALRRNRLALPAARRALELAGRLPAWLGHFAYVLARAGKTREALRTLEEAESAEPPGAPTALLAPAWLALEYKDRGLAGLSRAHGEHCPWFLMSRRDPRLAAVFMGPPDDRRDTEEDSRSPSGKTRAKGASAVYDTGLPEGWPHSHAG